MGKKVDNRERYLKIRWVLIYVLLLNWGVAAAKLLYGWLTRSASMTADGFHSFSDGSSNIIGLLGIWISSRPIDETHPYGHKKYETLTSIGISILLFLVCFNVVREGILRFLHPVVPEVYVSSFLVMGITLAINIGVMIYENRMGIALKSDILISDALHTRADILTSSSVIVSLIGIKFGYLILDPIASLVISGFIAYAAVDILKESSRVLSDGVAIPIEEIQRVVLSIRGVKECHRIRSRGRGDDIHIDLHVLVDPEVDVHRAHHLSYAIENKIKRDFHGVTDVVVHMEPLEKKEEKNKGRI
ncbi:MAG: cation diffusion facilitator family transporter [Desulfobacterales bacterium]|jgi:cation diffusion facilitator family transporter|nr:cation diffusion facilitator family transporter [Desulfobacterales bacterium]